ncbi:MAG: hypothetical protein ACO3RU_10180, partial [Planctomycetota bacterium]
MTANLRLAFALRKTADRLADGARYEWGHVGRCNCGHVAQTLTDFDDRQILRIFGQDLSEWTEHARNRCADTNRDLVALFDVLHTAGMSHEDVLHLENLSDPRILARMPDGDRDLQRCQQLRFLAFIEVRWHAGARDGPALDADEFDARCQHVMIEDA